jgi:hypothetical protein
VENNPAEEVVLVIRNHKEQTSKEFKEVPEKLLRNFRQALDVISSGNQPHKKYSLTDTMIEWIRSDR